jgi:hypothetical protein
MSNISNTASLVTNLNTDPYYDDYDEAKGFYRILFRPGLAVQARELTQMQTILQNQIDRFGEHIFKEGSAVRGCEVNYDQRYAFVKLRNNTSVGASVNAAAFINSTVTGASTGVTALVVNAAGGAEANTPYTKTLFVKYTGSGTAGTTKMFAANEVLTGSVGGLTANVYSTAAVGYGSAVTVGGGIIFAKDHFIRVEPQTLILSRYSSNTTYRVGYTVNETIVDSASDATLLDPARGSYNYAAPGARRLKLDVTLTAVDLADTNTPNFIEVLQIKNGILQTLSDKPQYNVIKDYLAQRTYDTQGNMIVHGMDIRLREHLLSGNNNGVFTSGEGGLSTKLSADVSPGKSYVQGYDLEHLVTAHVSVDKATDSAFVDTAIVAANYGNTIDVDNVVGQWDVNAQGTVSLRSQQANAILTKVYSGGTSPATQIGTARIRAVEYVSGAPGDPAARYRLYLHDTQMSAGKSFANVQCLVYSAGAGNANGKADIVGSTGNNAAISTGSLNRAVFSIPAQHVKRLRTQAGAVNNTWKFVKSFDGTFDIAGQLTLNTGDASETFSGSGALGATLARSRFYATLRTSGNTSLLSGTCNTTSGSNSAYVCPASWQTQLNVGDVIKLSSHATPYTISAVSLGSFRTLSTATASTTAATAHKKFYVGQVIDLGGYGRDGARSVNVTSATTALLDMNETLNSPTSLNATIITQLNKVDGQEASKTVNRARLVQLRLTDNAATTIGPWNLGLSDGFKLISVRKKTSTFTATSQGTDVTGHFTLDSGMRDNAYTHAMLVKKPTSTLSLTASDYLLVTFDCFTHSYSGGKGFLSVDSYPVNDATAGVDTTKIYTYEIPLFVSPLNGQVYDLRDSVDIRPRETDTATNTTTIGTVSTNPVASTAYDMPSGGLHFAVPNTDFNTDLEYYLPRKDVISQTKAGQFTVTKGVPSLLPDVPQGPADSMELATVSIAPYPSLPPEVAKQAGRPDLACEVLVAKHPRLTMGDLGALRTRVEQLEYFLALNMLEKEAQSMLIADSLGVDRFKNGLLVDSFVGHNIGNVTLDDYKAAIDTKTGEFRPPVRLDATELFLSSANSSNVVRTNTTMAGVSRDQLVLIANSQANYANGETLTCGAATGILRYHVDHRLVIENATAAFTVGPAIVGGTSGASTIATAVTASTPVGDLVTLPYTHTALVTQTHATTTRNAAGVAYTWRGTMTLTPDTDYWMDTAARPEVQANFAANADNWLYMPAAWTSVWKGWQTYWTGAVTPIKWTSIGSELAKTTPEVGAKKTWAEIRPISNPETSNQKYGTTRVVDTNIQPIMRGREIKVLATGLKPSTRFYAFFDGTNVSAYLTPTNSSYVATGAEGSAVISDSSGTVYALFRISSGAALRFRTGRKLFRLADSSTNSSALGVVTSSAEAFYGAQGISSYADGSMISTRPYLLAGDSIIPSTTMQNVRPLAGSGQEQSGAGGDALAQSFTVSGFQTDKIVGSGVYLTKVDLYFAAKDTTAPVIVEIREMDSTTGFLSPKVLPFSQVIVPAASVYTKSVSSVAVPIPTTVYFTAPVFVVNGKDYAIVVRPAGSNPNYAMFVARLGQNDLVTGNRISAQPAAGRLFVPTNNQTFTAIDEEDLSFVLYAASFDTAVTGTAVVKNAPVDMLTVVNPSAPFIRVGETIHGETTFTLNSSLTINTAITVCGNTSLANGVITYTSGTAMRIKGVTLANKFQSGETVHFLHANGLPIKAAGLYTTRTISKLVTPTAKVLAYDTATTANTILKLSNVSFSNTATVTTGATFVSGYEVKGQANGYTATIGTVQNLIVDAAQILSDYLAPANTALTAGMKMATSTTTRETSAVSMPLNDVVEYAAPKYLISRSNEANTSATTSTMGTLKSSEVIITLTSASRHVSPAVDLKRLALITVENQINSNSAIGTTEDAVVGGGSAKARYITRTVTLADGQDAEDLRVYLTAYKHTGAEVSVYYKILHREDSDTFEQAKWIPMTQLTASTVQSDVTDTADVKEFSYGVPSYSNAYKSGANTSASSVVEYRNSLSARYVGFKYFAVKVVLTDSDTASPPRVSNLRVIALQM